MQFGFCECQTIISEHPKKNISNEYGIIYNFQIIEEPIDFYTLHLCEVCSCTYIIYKVRLLTPNQHHNNCENFLSRCIRRNVTEANGSQASERIV